MRPLQTAGPAALRRAQTDAPRAKPASAALAAELDRLEKVERQERDRKRQENIAKLRDMARYD